MKIVIDRFEGKFAVCELEDGSLVNVPKELFQDANEGDIVLIEVLKEETEERKKSLNNRLKRLFRD